MADFSLNTIKNISLEAILNQLTVQQYFDRVYEVAGLPMICFDTSFHHIAHTFETPFYLQSWAEISMNSKAEEEDIDRYNYLIFQEETVAAGKSIRVDSIRDAGHACASCAVKHNGKLLAYCGTMIEDCQTELVLELNDIVSKTIPHLLHTVSEIFDRKSLSQLITCESLSKAETAAINEHLPTPYFISVLSPLNRGISTMQYIQNYIESHLENSVSAVEDNGDVYILFFNTTTDDISLNLLEMLEALGRKYSFQAAFSCSFFDAAEIPMRRKQAMQTMNIGRYYHPQQHMYYLRFIYPELIAYYATRSIDAEITLIPELKKLRSYAPDKTNEYFTDLFYYLYYSENYQLAAKQLGIHKNTLIYRISQICSIIECDLSDSRLNLRMLLSLYMWFLDNELLPEGFHEQD